MCWDGEHARAVRQGIWDGYKAARATPGKPEPERPISQAKEWCTLAGLHHVERDHLEADDLIANYWRQNRPLAERIVVLSGDKDFLQLIGPETVVVRPLDKGQTDRWDEDRVRAEYGCEARLLPYVKALMGDVSDGVPGLPGVGPKKAVKRILAADGYWSRLLDGHTSDERSLLVRNLMLMDLRNEVPYEPLVAAPGFAPVRPGSLGLDQLLAFLDRYRLDSVRARVLDGSLWPSEETVPTS
jgi:5'-3' exonuclease